MSRWLGRLTLLVLLAAPFWLGALILKPTPWVAAPTQATPEDAAAVKRLVRRVKGVTENPGADPSVRASLGEINAALSFGSRLVPGLRAEAVREGEGLVVRLSAPVPLLPSLGWVNAEASVPEFDAGPELARLRLGGIDLPPRTSLDLATHVADLILGGDAGHALRDAVPWMRLEDDGLRMALVMDGSERKGLTRRVSALLRGDEMPTGSEIQAHYTALREALDAGELPDRGSFLPYLRWITERSLSLAEPGREGHAFTAALFALTKLCGAKEFRLVVGRLAEGTVPEESGQWARSCDRVTFAGRIDTKRHFVTAAAIKAASTIKVSFTIGEFKELFDTARRKGGFDFTDIVANASGIRFAERMMSAERAEWPELIARLVSEGDVLADFEGVPGKLRRSEFEARFGNVESARYHEMLARIEAKIDALALHAPLAPSGG